MLGFKRFYNARRVVAGVELAQKILKGQFEVLESFGTDAFGVWRNVIAASTLCHPQQILRLQARFRVS